MHDLSCKNIIFSSDSSLFMYACIIYTILKYVFNKDVYECQAAFLSFVKLYGIVVLYNFIYIENIRIHENIKPVMQFLLYSLWNIV